MHRILISPIISSAPNLLKGQRTHASSLSTSGLTEGLLHHVVLVQTLYTISEKAIHTFYLNLILPKRTGLYTRIITVSAMSNQERFFRRQKSQTLNLRSHIV